MSANILKTLAFYVLALMLTCTTSLAMAKTSTAVFAGGCFWCIEHDFQQVPGVEKVVSGYTGGKVKNPTYKQVSAGGTGHYEAVKVYYDPKKVSYKRLLQVFWRSVDPTDGGGQFCDRGDQYRSAIFYKTVTEKEQAQYMKKDFVKDGKFKNVETKILPAKQFYPAEDYHQDYADKNPVRYKYYRYTCGRDARLEEVWGDE